MGSSEGEKLLPNLETRRCPVSGNENMTANRRSLSGFSTESVFVCPNCSHKASLSSAGSSGFYLAGGIVATGAIALVMAGAKGFSQTEAIVTALLLAFFTAPALLATIARWHHPVTGSRERTVAARASSPSDPVQKGIAWLDAFGFLKSFFGLFVFLALWLVFWAAVGLIKDAFF